MTYPNQWYCNPSYRFPKRIASALARTTAEYGSFKDSRKAPIHRWFAYPAGYSYKLVEENMKRYGLDSESLVADPFLGSGTTTLAASHSGVPSVGTEAHPFVSWVATTKCTVHDVESLMCFRDACWTTYRTKTGARMATQN